MREFLYDYVREVSASNKFNVYESEIDDLVDDYMTIYEDNPDEFIKKVYTTLKDLKLVELSKRFNALMINQISKSSSFQ